MKYDFHEHIKDFRKDRFERFVLAGDVGATNTRLGMVGVERGLCSVIFQLHFNSRELSNLIQAMNETLRLAKEKYDVETDTASFGIPGMVSSDRQAAAPTHLPWKVVAREILDNSFLGKAILLNDVEAMGFGLEFLSAENPAEMLPLEHGHHYQPRPAKFGTKLVLAAGSGLGEAFLVFDPHYRRYVPCASEGGHVALPTQSPLELEFEEFIQKELKCKIVTYEHAVSGPGLARIFSFLKAQRGFKASPSVKPVEEAEDKPTVILELSKSDALCKKAVELFLYFYAKGAQNKALEFLPFGGLYLAGGLAQHNPDSFSKNGFMMDFEQGSDRASLLREVPVFLVTEPHAVLLGAAYAAVHFPHYAVSK